MDVSLKYGAVLVSFFGIYIVLVNLSWLTLLTVTILGVTLSRFVAAAFTDGDLMLYLAEKFGHSIDRLNDQVVWVTGASSGIGESLAVILASHGAKVVLSARREDALERVRQRCLAAEKCVESNIMVLPMDVLEEEKHSLHLQAILDRFGQLDILVNNAGRSQRAMWEEIHSEVDHQLFQLDVFSAISLSRTVLKYFLSREGGAKGHIAVTSSMAGKIGAAFSGSYCGAKHALHGYFECLRAEKAGSGIHVTLLCPGPVETNFLSESFTSDPNQKYSQRISPSPYRLTAERCGYLSAVALANRLCEAWIAKRPLVLMVYFYIYCPNLVHFAMRTLGPKFILRIRDNQSSIGH